MRYTAFALVLATLAAGCRQPQHQVQLDLGSVAGGSPRPAQPARDPYAVAPQKEAESEVPGYRRFMEKEAEPGSIKPGSPPPSWQSPSTSSTPPTESEDSWTRQSPPDAQPYGTQPYGSQPYGTQPYGSQPYGGQPAGTTGGGYGYPPPGGGTGSYTGR